MVEIAVNEERDEKKGEYKDEIGAIEEDLPSYVKDFLEDRMDSRG